MMMGIGFCSGFALLLLCGVTNWGCSEHLPNTQLENVAKDWSMVVRAGQVIPVYPLTEDLQPGDILLVQTPIDKQQEVFEQKGFLPLDNLIYRIQPSEYAEFYLRSFGVGANSSPIPRSWMYPAPNTAPWGMAPSASFPSYSFSVRDGGGFNLALPVQGVPIAISLLDATAARGTITIADARTYGIDTRSLYFDVMKWARQNSKFLEYFGPSTKQHKRNENYLRVITRVFLAGRLNIALQSASSASYGGSGGFPKPVDLVVPAPTPDPQKDALEAYDSNLQRLTKMIESAINKVPVNGVDQFMPGGTVKVVAASTRSINLIETFSRPLVFGYVGFDIPIQEDGRLGPPIPTHAVLSKQINPEDVSAKTMLFSIVAARLTYEELKHRSPPPIERIREFDELETLVPEKFECNIYENTDYDKPPTISFRQGEFVRERMRDSGFSLLTTYRGKILLSIESLEQAESHGADKIECPDHGASCLEEQLTQNRRVLSQLQESLGRYSYLLSSSKK